MLVEKKESNTWWGSCHIGVWITFILMTTRISKQVKSWSSEYTFEVNKFYHITFKFSGWTTFTQINFACCSWHISLIKIKFIIKYLKSKKIRRFQSNSQSPRSKSDQKTNNSLQNTTCVFFILTPLAITRLCIRCSL